MMADPKGAVEAAAGVESGTVAPAETAIVPAASPVSAGQATAPNPPATKMKGPTRSQLMNKLYALPAPLRTFPLPTLVPHNPLSLFHLVYVWLSQSLKPPSSHMELLYQGLFSPETRSVHVTDSRSIRGLWEQGFYGKGTLSRSEPSWLNREQTRRGDAKKKTSEDVTRERRAQRQQAKWERARKEREAIDQTLSEEAEAEAAVQQEVDVGGDLELAPSVPLAEVSSEDNLKHDEAQLEPEFVAPVGPLELLSLPDSLAKLESRVMFPLKTGIVECCIENFDAQFIERFYAPPVGPMELLVLPNSIETHLPTSVVAEETESEGISEGGCVVETASPETKTNGHRSKGVTGVAVGSQAHEDVEAIGGSESNDDAVDSSVHSEDTTQTNVTHSSQTDMNGPSTPRAKGQKSVRFSPTVEKNTFIETELPSPEQTIVEEEEEEVGQAVSVVEEEPLVIRDQEHLQLTLEETFFLAYSLGALQVINPITKTQIPNQDLFSLCRRNSYFPPLPKQATLSPDDPFMINYVVYHHFRSLGWVVRSGIKFSVDYMIYVRGPVFTHAEFAILIIPSYSDPYWSSNPVLQNYVKERQSKTWHWISCINRVITQVKKTLVLTYVDIPKPVDGEEEKNLGIHGVLGRYRVKEVIMKRFSANRMRD